MPQSISDIVDSLITRETAAISRQGLNIPLFVYEHSVGSGRIAKYKGSSILADMATAGHVTTEAGYIAVSEALKQNPRLNEIWIGKREAAEAPATAMANIELEDATGWIGFSYDTVDATDIANLASWAEGTNHMFFAQSSDADILTGTEDCIADTLNEATYLNTASYYHQTDTEFLAFSALCRGLGRNLDLPNGNGTWSGDTLVGFTLPSLTGAQRANVHGFKMNTHEARGGRNIVREGWVASGEFIDLSIGMKWLNTRMEEDVHAVLHANPDGLPYDQGGIDALALVVRDRLETAVRNRVLRAGTIDIRVPTMAEIAASDIAARHARTIEWTAEPQHFIHKATIRGRVIG